MARRYTCDCIEYVLAPLLAKHPAACWFMCTWATEQQLPLQCVPLQCECKCSRHYIYMCIVYCVVSFSVYSYLSLGVGLGAVPESECALTCY